MPTDMDMTDTPGFLDTTDASDREPAQKRRLFNFNMNNNINFWRKKFNYNTNFNYGGDRDRDRNRDLMDYEKVRNFT